MSTLSYQQNVTLLQYGFGSAIALVLVLMTTLVVGLVFLFERRGGQGGD
jgi:ABC-type spermidine/putrescine transport system permease subunit I